MSNEGIQFTIAVIGTIPDTPEERARVLRVVEEALMAQDINMVMAFAKYETPDGKLLEVVNSGVRRQEPRYE